QYRAIRQAQLFDWELGGNGMLVGTNFGETMQVHRVTTPGGDRRQLTFFPDRVAGAVSVPKGFVFLMDRGGNERYPLYRSGAGTGRHTLLADGKSRAIGLRLSNGRAKMAFASTRRNGKDYALYVLSLSESATPRLVKENRGLWQPLDWSKGDRRILVR